MGQPQATTARPSHRMLRLPPPSKAKAGLRTRARMETPHHPGEMNNGPPAAGPPAAEPPVGHASNGPDGGQGRPPDEGTDGNAAHPGENAQRPAGCRPAGSRTARRHASGGPDGGQGRPPDEGTDGNAAHPGENATTARRLPARQQPNRPSDTGAAALMAAKAGLRTRARMETPHRRPERAQ